MSLLQPVFELVIYETSFLFRRIHRSLLLVLDLTRIAKST